MDIVKNNKACYAAVVARDTRFDGRIFVGVSSTGIYCRPVCRVKVPKRENCKFFSSAAAAEAMGFRPCLKCRPEMSPGYSVMDASSNLAKQAAVMMGSVLISDTIAGISAHFGVTTRHFNRVFHAEHGVPPSSYLRSCRLLMAKRLLTDTSMSVTDIAYASGFGSVNRFNEQFKKHYGMTPGMLRKDVHTQVGQAGITLYQAYRPPYDWHGILNFLETRAIDGVENISDGCYMRTVSVKDSRDCIYTGWISVSNEPQKNRLAVTITDSLAPVISTVLARIRLLFDLDCVPEQVEDALGELEGFTAGMRVPGAFDPFELAVRTVLGQQITVKAAATLAKRIAATFGMKIDTPYPALTQLFPDTAKILSLENIEEALGRIGVIRSRSRSIRAVAEALESGTLCLQPGTDVDKAVSAIKKLPGFGDWSAQYILMRTLGWPDAFLPSDYGVKMAIPGKTPAEISNISKKWMPWRSYAMMCLWRSLQ